MGTVLLLLACIVLLFLNNQRRKRLYEEQVEIAAANETEYTFTERETETESETQASTPAPATEAPVQPAETNAAAPETNADGTPVTPQTNAVQNLTTEERLQDIVVLNGTNTDGVARYWADQLEQAGFLNVVSASFNAQSQENTVIYAQNGANAGVLRAVFPDAQFTVGALPEGTIQTAEGESLPEQVDIYVLLGRNDVIN